MYIKYFKRQMCSTSHNVISIYNSVLKLKKEEEEIGRKFILGLRVF